MTAQLTPTIASAIVRMDRAVTGVMRAEAIGAGIIDAITELTRARDNLMHYARAPIGRALADAGVEP